MLKKKMNIQIILLFTFVLLCESSSEDFYELIERRFLFNNVKYPNCINHENCKAEEYCFVKNRQLIGYCAKKHRDFEACIGDYQCESDYCHWNRCKGLPAFKNIERGNKCQMNDECNHEQRCERYKCVDKTQNGWCATDSHCMSNHCKLFKCTSYVARKRI